jgi:hypothetical protein
MHRVVRLHTYAASLSPLRESLVSAYSSRLAGFGVTLLAALVACHPAAPAGTAPAACRHPAVVFRNLYNRSVAVYRPTVPYGPAGELLVELAPGDSSEPIPLDRARGSLLRDAVTGASVDEERVKIVERCLDPPAPRPTAPSAPESRTLSQARRDGQ